MIAPMLLSCVIILFSSMAAPSYGTATWYGEEFVGRRHAASWHGETPDGFPETVDMEHLGVAAPASVPFGMKLKITRLGTCWGEESEWDGASVVAVVVDRKARWWVEGYYDLWPATAEALGFGPLAEIDAGCLKVAVETLDNVCGTCYTENMNTLE